MTDSKTYPPFYETVFERIVGHEGSYVLDSRDPGGETKFGISKRSYPTLNIKELTLSQAKAIWFHDFWMPVRDLPHQSVQFQLCDAAYNHGFHNAVQFLQRAVGVADDGIWGPRSKEAYSKLTENDILLRFIGYRLQFMTKLSTFTAFGRGWSSRIAENLFYAAADN